MVSTIATQDSGLNVTNDQEVPAQSSISKCRPAKTGSESPSPAGLRLSLNNPTDEETVERSEANTRDHWRRHEHASRADTLIFSPTRFLNPFFLIRLGSNTSMAGCLSDLVKV
jgi:hypothetical protein